MYSCAPRLRAEMALRFVQTVTMVRNVKGFLFSMGNVLDLFGVCAEQPRLHRHEQTILGAWVRDSDALADDWRHVGNDIRSAWLREIYDAKEGPSRKAAS